MKIHSNNNLLPYIKNPYEVVPAVPPGMEKGDDEHQQAIAERNDAYKRGAYKYYVRTNDENTTYNAERRIVSQQWHRTGMLIDTYG